MEKQYLEFIEGIELLDIFLGTGSFKRNGFPDPKKYPEVSASLTHGKTQYKQGKKHFEVDHEIILSIEETSEKPKKKHKLFEAKALFTLIYRTATPVTEEVFEEFKKKNIPVNLQPYMREYIHNCMSRAGLPPFTLPVLKIKR